MPWYRWVYSRRCILLARSCPSRVRYHHWGTRKKWHPYSRIPLCTAKRTNTFSKIRTGSNSVRGKETERVVPLMISAHNPSEAREANSHLFDVIGAVFFVPGIWLAYISF